MFRTRMEAVSAAVMLRRIAVLGERGHDQMYAPFKYAVNAYCLDNIQTFDRRYVTLEDALLHCLNGFNENANIPNRYKSIGHYLSGKS